MTILDDGMALLADSLPWRKVIFRLDGENFTIEAVRGGTSWGDVTRFGTNAMETNSRDYIFRAADLPKMPKVKDCIEDDGDEWIIFKNASESCWRYCGPAKNLVRVHCRK